MQKGFVQIIVIAAAVVLIGAGVYVVLNRQSAPSVPSTSPEPSPTLASRPTPTPAPTLSPTPTLVPTAQFTRTELKYRLEDTLGQAIFCGPPVVWITYEQELIAQFPAVMANVEEFLVILKRTNIVNDGQWSDQEKLTVVREHNRLSVITLENAGSNRYTFMLRSRPAQENKEFIFEGFITGSGQIEIIKKEPYLYACPICLAKDTLIDTPVGDIPIQEMREGMPVWTMNKFGERIAGVVIAASQVLAPPTHRMVHVVLDDGRELFVSPGHPLSDRRAVAELVVGDLYDGARVVSAPPVAYGAAVTYDILPSGETGFYWANGILLDSTLH